MSKTFQKFELLKLKAFIEQESFKVIRVDNVVNAKENLQNIVNVIKHGKMLTRNQIIQAIDVIQDIKLREGVEFSITEQQVNQILEEDLDFTKPLVVNFENQTLVHLSRLYSMDLQVKADNKAAQRKLQKSYSNLIVFARLIVTNSEFRVLIEAFFNLIRDILKENSVPGADNHPSSEEIIDKNDRKKSKPRKVKKIINEKICSSRNQGSRSKAEINSTGKHARQASDLTDITIRNTNCTRSKRKHIRLVSDLTGITVQEIDTKEKSVINNDIENTDQTKSGNSKTSNYSKTQSKYNPADVKNNSSKANIEIRTRRRDKRNQSNEVTNQVNLDDEQLKLLADQLTDIIQIVQSHPEYRKALEGIFDVLYNIKKNYKTAADNAVSQIKGEGDVYLEELLFKAKKAVENFAGDYSLDNLVSLMKESNDIMESDPKVHRLMHHNYKFILYAFKDRKFMYNDKFNEKAASKFQSTRRHLLKTYSGPLKRILTEGTTFFDALRDPTANHNITNLENLTNELFMNNTGRPTIKYDILHDFHKFVPILANRLKRLDIPRISKENDGVEYILDNISLNCENILPKNVHIHTDAGFNSEDRILNIITLKVQAIQASAQNITFYFKKKMLLGNIEDAGIVNVTIDKGGLDIFLKLSPKTINSNEFTSNKPKFIVIDSKCQVNNVNVKFQHGKFDLIYKMFNKTIQSTIKRQIKTIVSQGIRDFFEGKDDTCSSQNFDNPLNILYQLDDPFDLGPDGWKSRYPIT